MEPVMTMLVCLDSEADLITGKKVLMPWMTPKTFVSRIYTVSLVVTCG